MFKKKFSKKINFYFYFVFLKTILIIFIVFLIVLFLLNAIVSKIKKDFSENIFNENIIKKNFSNLVEVKKVKDYFYVAFYATFSGFGWLDRTQTDMYHDYSFSAFLYSPKIVLNKVEDENLKNYLRSNIDKVNTEENNLEENVKNILPDDLKNKNISDRFIKKLDNVYVVVFKELKNNIYYFWGYIYDGVNFQKIKNDFLFQSQYDGTISIGGNDDNFLIILNAYKGEGVQVRNFNLVNDLSKFLEIRLMGGGGYKLHIEKINFNQKNFWYLWIGENDFLKLVKFFEDEEKNIIGGIELTYLFNNLFNGLQRKLEFNIAKPIIDKKNVKIYLKINDDFYEFVDSGFDKSKDEYLIVSNNINNYPFPVKKVKVSNLDNFFDENKFFFEISQDKITWQKINLNEEIEINHNLTTFYWRLKIIPSGDLFRSVFLKGFLIEMWLDREL